MSPFKETYPEHYIWYGKVPFLLITHTHNPNSPNPTPWHTLTNDSIFVYLGALGHAEKSNNVGTSNIQYQLNTTEAGD